MQLIVYRYYRRHRPHMRFKRAFKIASIQLKKAYQSHNTAHIYHIMTQLFADRMHKSNAMVSQISIEQKLMSVGISQERLHEWNIFFDAIAAHAFGYTRGSDNYLFEQAKQWIDYLKKVL